MLVEATAEELAAALLPVSIGVSTRDNVGPVGGDDCDDALGRLSLDDADEPADPA